MLIRNSETFEQCWKPTHNWQLWEYDWPQTAQVIFLFLENSQTARIWISQGRNKVKVWHINGRNEKEYPEHGAENYKNTAEKMNTRD